MGWLISAARVLASVEVAGGHGARAKGLIGRDDVEGAFALRGCRWVHTFGVRFPIDVAYVDADDAVIKIETLAPRRLGMPVVKSRLVIEARAGSFERWGLRLGDPVEIRDTNPDATP